jgi:hypothetical protein
MPYNIIAIRRKKMLHKREARGPSHHVPKVDNLTICIFRKSAGYPWPDKDKDSKFAMSLQGSFLCSMEHKNCKEN